MTDYNRPVAAYADPVSRVDPARRSLADSGPALGSRDIAAVVVAAIMTLGPLAMAAFWAPYR